MLKMQRVLPILPLVAGVGCALLLYRSYDDSSSAHSLLNIHTWSIMKYSPVGAYALLHMMLISNVIMVMLSVVPYNLDIWEVLRLSPPKPGSEQLLTAGLLAFGAALTCIVWVVLYVGVNWLSTFGFDAETALSKLVSYNDVFVLVIFLLFLLGDISLRHSYTCGRDQCRRIGDTATARKFARRRRVANDSIWLIDLPVLIASILLWGITHSALTNPMFTVLGPKTSIIFTHVESGTRSMLALEAILPSVFANGFFLGAIISQLAYSQIVFAVLTLREEQEEADESASRTNTLGTTTPDNPSLSLADI